MFNKKGIARNTEFKSDELKKLSQLSERELMTALRTSKNGLTKADAAERLEAYGLNEVNAQKPLPAWKMVLHGFSDPFVLVLALLMVVSLVTNDLTGAGVMGSMILASVLISFVQEYRSQKASFALKEFIENTTAITRDGEIHEIPMDEVVPGDIVTLATGDMIPADAVIIWSKDLFVNQASLTGESLPVEKSAFLQSSEVDECTAMEMANLVFMGTDVLSGQGKAIILKTGQQTFFGDIARVATSRRNGTAFQLGMVRISKLLLRMVMVLFPIVLAINGITKGDWSDAFFFAIAVAVGLTPEMLPMIVTSNLAKGALSLSKHQVIVKELPAIQNLGSMDVLCTDKTGTITEDRVVLVEHLDSAGRNSEQVLDYAYLNSNYQTGWKNLMDIAVIEYYNKIGKTSEETIKIDEIPFDFSRRRLTVVVKKEEQQLMITKGAVEEMLEVCTRVEINTELFSLDEEKITEIRAINRRLNEQGMRVIAVATKKDVHDQAIYGIQDESDMVLQGFVAFLDPAKESAISAIDSLHTHGLTVKVLTGDNDIVAKKVCEDVGIPADRVLLGVEIDQLTEEQLMKEVEEVNLFAKLSPMQKARIIEMLQNNGHTVGFMGDGMNDAPALRCADVGISVDTAADITKDASSIILLEKSLDVLEAGVLEGRKVFSNMMKYIKMTISSNFGNVFSILVASAFLPFLPMLSAQLLIQNLIYDMAQLAIPWDHVDEEEIEKPVRWQTKGLLRFTLCIGPVSSIFDIITFLVMWFVFHADTLGQQQVFQTGWFVVGLISQTLVVHIIRTRKTPFVQSVASFPVILTSILAIIVGILLVLTPLRAYFGFVELPTMYWYWMVGIVLSYLLTVEVAKRLYCHFTREWI